MKQVLTPIVETIIRLFSKSPKYFQVLQTIITAIMAMCGFLTYAKSEALFDIPKWLLIFTGPQSIVMSFLTLLLASLPAKSTDQVKAKVDATLNK